MPGASRFQRTESEMSAICGIVNFDGAPVEAADLERMAHAAAAGAPVTTALAGDGTTGFAGSGSAGVAAGRGRPCLLAASARIDNREDLREEPTLDIDQPVDTAWLVSAYERWGEGWYRHLRGAFAAAAWEKEPRTLTLLRDPAGERGLYWSRTPRGLLFASEPAQILASGQVSREVNELALLAYLLGAPPDPAWSFFTQVHRAPEGCQVRLTAERIEVDRYWHWTATEAWPRQSPDAASELAHRLQAAVERRLARQGETGVLLSGGLDSSTIAALAAGTLEGRSRSLRAFTWTSQRGDGIDETRLSRALIRSRPNVVERPLEADALWPLSRYPEAYADCNSPETNTYPDLLWSTLEAAREQGVTVLMNGLGGDAVVGWLAPELSLLLSGRLSGLARRWRASGSAPWRAGLFREARSLATRRRLPEWLTPRAREMARAAGFDRSPLGWRALSSPCRFRRHALASPSQASALERLERLGRRAGVELSAPWCAPELGALAMSIPGCALEEAPPAKRLLRAAMAGRLPAEILDAGTAKGRTSQLQARGLLRHGRETVEALLSESLLAGSGLVDGAQILARYGQHREAQTTMPRLWEILTAETWLRVAEKSLIN